MPGDAVSVPLVPATLDPHPVLEYVPNHDGTSTIFGSTEVVDGKTVTVDSRYGDLDDYLAFTAVSTPGTWFTGRVPRYVLSGVSTETDPVVIRSRYAEIVYFTNPERDSGGNVIDGDGNGLPDRLLLYRRVLLIRPDLNLSSSSSVFGLSAGTDWQTSLTGAHLLSDLSVHRQIDPSEGTPTSVVVANSLDDLTQPHNRFAHVRIPSSVLSAGGSPAGTTMPILALEGPVDLITNTSTATPALRPADNSSGTSPVILDTRVSGFLHRNYVLSGDRKGEDVIANNCRGFDVQIFDPDALQFLTSQNLVVGPNDAGFREAFLDSTTQQVPGGTFVDLCYPVLAGGAMRGWQARQVALSNSASSPGNAAIPVGTGNANLTGLQSPFSGLEFETGATAFPTAASGKVYSESLLKSGRLLIVSNQIVLFQPAFDTFTTAYESDSYAQDRRFNSSTGLLSGTYWRQLTGSDATTIDLGSDGLDYPTPTSGTPVLPVRPGTDDVGERETSAPFTTTPGAIKVSVRLESGGSRQLRQSSVVFRGNR